MKDGKLFKKIFSYANGHLFIIVDVKEKGKSKVYKYHIHDLVFKLFSGIERPKGYHIHHIDGNASNNHIDNLTILTIKQHVQEHWDMWKAANPNQKRFKRPDKNKIKPINQSLNK